MSLSFGKMTLLFHCVSCSFQITSSLIAKPGGWIHVFRKPPWPLWRFGAATAAAKSLWSCPTLCDPIDGSPPGSPIPGILQVRTLEWVAISFSNAWKWKVKVKSLSRVRLFMTPWTAAYQSPSSMGFSRQEHWSGVPLPSLQGLETFELFSVNLWMCQTQYQEIWNCF